MPGNQTDQLAQRYNREAAAYRDLWAPVLRKAGSRMIHELSAVPAQCVLDVGAGVGTLAAEVRSAFPRARIVALDRSPGMLALAPEGICRAVADARELPVAVGCVDLVLLVFMLFHLDDPAEALREARRVLCPSGRAATITWGGEFESIASRVWNDCLDEHGAAAPDSAAPSRHEPVNTPQKIESLLRVSGFGSVRAWTEELTYRIDLGHLLALRTRMGSEKPRFDSLDPAAQETCLAAARRRMQNMGAKDFISRGEIVHAIASCA